MAEEKEKQVNQNPEEETNDSSSDSQSVDSERLKEYLGEEDSIEEEVEEEVEEETEPEPEPESDPEPPQPEIDPEQLKSEVREEVRNEVTQDLVEKLTGKTSEGLEDEGFEFSWDKEGRNPKDYGELAEEISRYQDFRQEKIAEEQQKQQQELEEQQKQKIKQWNDYWDRQLEDLRKEGELPEIKDPEDKNDPGVKAQNEIFSKMSDFNEERLQSGRTGLYDIKDFIRLTGETSSNDQPAGADAPVSGGKTSVQQDDGTGEFSYEDIHTSRGYEDLIGS